MMNDNLRRTRHEQCASVQLWLWRGPRRLTWIRVSTGAGRLEVLGSEMVATGLKSR